MGQSYKARAKVNFFNQHKLEKMFKKYTSVIKINKTYLLL